MRRMTLVVLLFSAAGPARAQFNDSGSPARANTTPTPAEAAAFMEDFEAALRDLWVYRERSNWVKATFITQDTNLLTARAEAAVMEYVARKAEEAKRFEGLALDDSLRRKFKLLKLSLSLPAPSDQAKQAELARIVTEMGSDYGKGKYCPEGDKGPCRTLGDLSKTLATSRDYDELKEAWIGWRTIAPPMREKYVRFVTLANEGAQAFGFHDLGELWRSKYDMPPDEFEAELTRLWDQVRPLYEQLHCYVRSRLQAYYGADKVPSGKPIPAHLLGNMWSQEWGNIFDLVAPESETAFDLGDILVAKKLGPQDIVRQAEAFFVSLGLDPLPATF